MGCEQCGICCVNNGLIPPVAWTDESVPEWLRLLVTRLRVLFPDSGNEHCIFLTDDMRCAIYEDRPAICRRFKCDTS